MSETSQLADLQMRVAKLERAVAFLETHLGVKFQETPPTAAAPAPAAPPFEVVALVRGGDKIGAIVLYRKLTGVGLKEAKDFVETIV